VFGDDRVTCHMGADDVSSGFGDAKSRSEGYRGDYFN